MAKTQKRMTKQAEEVFFNFFGSLNSRRSFEAEIMTNVLDLAKNMDAIATFYADLRPAKMIRKREAKIAVSQVSRFKCYKCGKPLIGSSIDTSLIMEKESPSACSFSVGLCSQHRTPKVMSEIKKHKF